jgi:hypothetical protein
MTHIPIESTGNHGHHDAMINNHHIRTNDANSRILGTHGVNLMNAELLG